MVALVNELWFNPAMLKAKALGLLGGSVASAAEAIGISYQAIDKWPDELPPRIADRVLAALARKHLPASLIGSDADAAERRVGAAVNPCPDTDRRAPAALAGEG